MVRLLAAIGLIGMQVALAQRVGAPTGDLENLSVDELFQLQVTSVGKKAQQLSRTPAAVFVLTADDIRRSGATSIPEALQWVPGLTVLRVDGRFWTVSARGSASLYADKILVMIDGRSLYTPLFSGVRWDSIDVPLEDIEQIEVVRGPGAVMWGPNAVNGVINIITKSAETTKGGEVSAATGNELRGSLFARYGGTPSEKIAYRIWGKFEDRNPAFSSPGSWLMDGAFLVHSASPVDNLSNREGRLGFEVDLRPSGKDQVTIRGDLYALQAQEVFGFPVVVPVSADIFKGRSTDAGGSLQARWTRTTSADSESTLQFTLDRAEPDYYFIAGTLNNLTLDYEKRLQTGERNEVYWGAGFQQYWDNTRSVRLAGFDPLQSTYRVGDVVLRDERQLIPDRLMVSAGIRLDYSSWSHFQFQPSLRLLYTPSARQSLWTAVSRAVRVPSRTDRDFLEDGGVQLEGGIPVELEVFGSTSMRSEIAWTAEAGHRFQAGQRWSVDSSVFWTWYSRLRTLAMPAQPEVDYSSGTPVLRFHMTEQNGATGRAYGGEAWLTWQVRPGWKLIPSYSYLNEVFWKPPADAWLVQSSGSPHQGLLRSQFDIARHLQLDVMARARTRNTAFDLPGVLLLDVRLGWRPDGDTEISIAVNNLTGRSVLETYAEGPFAAIPLQRTFVLKCVRRF